MEEILVRSIHFLGIIILSAALVGEHLLISKEIDLTSFKKLVLLDGVYGFSAIMVLVAGLLLWLGVGKPNEFYSHNIIFQAKLTMFVIIAILSAFPTYYFLRNRKVTSNSVVIPNYIITIIRVEITFLAILPLLAVMMAHGIGNVR